jgi:putative cell wall-binding protein
VSAATFAPGVATAYVASGNGWPDALAAVPHAARAGGPLLLTNTGSLPAVVKAELQRLRPGRIMVLGGTGVVSGAVATALDAYTGGAVIRLAGPDRYGTAAAISSFHLPSGARLAYVATGENFPDALAAGPAAAVRGASTILVRRDSIPGRSAAELDRLNVTRLILLGGPGVVSQAVASSLARFAGN